MPDSRMKLTYFDTPGGRGEPARLAFHIGGVEFEDVRIPMQKWPEVRGTAPFHACPFLEANGTILAQSNAISRYVGRLTGLYPEDPWQAALCDEILEAVEEMWMRLGPTMGLKDPEQLKAAREALAEVYKMFLQQFAQRLKRAGGEYFAGGSLSVADLQILTVCRALGSGFFDHIPTDLVQTAAPELEAHVKKLMDNPKIKEHYAAFASNT